MEIKNIAILFCSALVFSSLNVRSAFADDAKNNTNCNQVVGEIKKVHVQIKSYSRLHFAVNREHGTSTTTRDVKIELNGEVSNEPGKAKAKVVWVFKREEAGKNDFPKCQEADDKSVKITIPYGYWQMSAMMKLFSTFPAAGIVCHYASDANQTNSNAGCFHKVSIER